MFTLNPIYLFFLFFLMSYSIIADDTGFRFGSYGRIGVGSDLRGGTETPVTTVAHGPRITEKPYLELEFRYKMAPQEKITTTVVITPAFSGEPFHYTGEFFSSIALRNLFAEIGYKDWLGIWVGSKMYRGDDIYLLDFWPLDNLNTTGGGVWYNKYPLWVGIHGGVNRLKNSYQYQVIETQDPIFGKTEVVFMDRQRLILSAKGEYKLWGKEKGEFGMKFKLYTEFHYISSGEFKRADQTIESLPKDYGWCIGAQIGMWGFGERESHLNLFLKYSGGLASYGEMSIPFGVDTKKQAQRAKEFLVGLSGNYEYKMVSISIGGYLRYFKDADPNVYDIDDKWEYIIVLRPYLFWLNYFGSAIEFSFEQQFPFGLNPQTKDLENPYIIAGAIFPIIITPYGAGTYTRPHFRFIYRASYLSKEFRNTLPKDNPLKSHSIEHFLGIQAEWWFNSSYK